MEGAPANSLADALTAYKLVRTRRFAEALQVYDALLAQKPERPELWINRGVALQALYRLDEAVESFETALRHRPDYTASFINRGAVRNWQADYGPALADYDRAVELEPDNEAALLGRSTVLCSMGRFADAIADADVVLQANTGSGGAHYNKALTLLSMGDYAEGFREHEWRFGTEAILGRHRFPQPMWQGQRTDKRILVHCEQGLGDSIQFARYLPRLCGLNVTVEAPKVLLRLLQGFGFAVVERGQELPSFDLHCPLMSMAAIFGTTLDSVPREFPYLYADARDKDYWANELRHHPQPRIGLAWWSGVRMEQPIARAMQARKTVPTMQFTELLNADFRQGSFVSLQKDEPTDGSLDYRLIFDPMPQCRDLADTAAVVANLDLVICVDSAVAHLAGAMGKPVWVLNRYDICWRWLSGGRESPWYDNAKVFRQDQPRDWSLVLREVQRELELWIGKWHSDTSCRSS